MLVWVWEEAVLNILFSIFIYSLLYSKEINYKKFRILDKYRKKVTRSIIIFYYYISIY